MFFINEITFFIVNYCNNFDLTLRTQVMNTGRIVLVGLDKWGHERLNLKMNKTETGEAISSVYDVHAERKNYGWADVSDSEMSDDDLSSYGRPSISASAASPMSNVFVDQFTGTNTHDVPHFAINDANAISS